VRSLLLLVMALGACDLQPPPPKKTPPPTTATPTDLPPPPPQLDVAVDAAPAAPPDAFETSAACNDVGVKVAASIIDNATDPAQKSQLGQERDRIVRRVAEACTRDNWTQPQRDCFLKAKTADEMQACGRDLAAPREG
jgi:hypothetical protein